MTKRNLLAGLLLIVFVLTAGCAARPAQPTDIPAAETTPAAAPSPTPTPEPTTTPDPIAEAVAAMTTEQKVSQLLVAGIEGTQLGQDAVQAVQDYQVGGVILFGRNVESAWQLAELTNGLKDLNGDYTPLFLCVDQEGGRVDRMPPEVADLPSAYTFGERYDASLLQQLGQTLGAECAAFGFNMDFAPVMDVWSNPDNTVIGDRAYSSDPSRAANAAAWVAGGLADTGVIAVGKHFPGHGSTSIDSHVELPVVDQSKEDWLSGDAVPFWMATDSAVPAIMVGHILMPQLDPDRPASLSYTMVTELLRGELRFDGVVCTDDLTMGAVSNTYGMGEAAVLAVEAGCDLLLVCHGADNLTAARDALLEAADSGRLSPERLDESVRRILSLKAEYGLTNDPVDTPDVDALNARIGALTEQITEASS